MNEKSEMNAPPSYEAAVGGVGWAPNAQEKMYPNLPEGNENPDSKGTPYPPLVESTYPHPQAPQPVHGAQAYPYPQGGQVYPPPTDISQPQPIPASTVNVVVAAPVGPKPTNLVCPHCQKQVTTRLEYNPDMKTHVAAVILCIVGCCLCSCIPYCMDTCRKGNHFCPNCGAFLGSYNSH